MDLDATQSKSSRDDGSASFRTCAHDEVTSHRRFGGLLSFGAPYLGMHLIDIDSSCCNEHFLSHSREESIALQPPAAKLVIAFCSEVGDDSCTAKWAIDFFCRACKMSGEQRCLSPSSSILDK